MVRKLEDTSPGEILKRGKTIITYALAFASAICVSGYLCLCCLCGHQLTVPEFLRFSSTILWNTMVHSNESGGSRSLQLARESSSRPILNSKVEISGKQLCFPLPKYTVFQEGQRYLTFASFDELQDYFRRRLPATGWRHVEQMGAGHFFEGHGAKIVITHHFYLGKGISQLNVSVMAE